MKKIKEEIVSYLNMGLNPTVIGFQDDGLFYLFETLLKGTPKSTGYDPTFSFIHVATSSISNITTESIESALNEGLLRDDFPGDTIIETIVNGVDVVCVLDDLAFIEKPEEVIAVADALSRKYRERLRFVYLIEDPTLLERVQQKVPPDSKIFEAFVYQQIGMNWTAKELAKMFKDQFKKELTEQEVEEISQKTHNHFGIFKRMYKDTALDMSTVHGYTQLLVDNMPTNVINTLRKTKNEEELDTQESKIIEQYSKVNLVTDGEITIPLLAEKVYNTVVKNKIDINDDQKLTGLDLHVFKPAERRILELLMQSAEPVSKHNLGDAIWREKADEKYSEWAIDQRIARLRRKIIDNGFNVDVQTVYGKGYKIVKI